MILNEIQQDILKELFNRGIGKAAEILSEMLRSEIILSVPTLTIVSQQGVCNEMNKSVNIGVKQTFNGEYTGNAIILYGYESSLEVIGNLLGYDEIPKEFGHFEKETLSEFGNIILTSCLISFENALGVKLSTSNPDILMGSFPNDFITTNNVYDELIFLNMKFSLSTSSQTGQITLILKASDLKDLAPRLDSYMEKLLTS